MHRISPGVLDTLTALTAGDYLARVIQDTGGGPMQVDFSGVSFISAAMLGRLVELRRLGGEFSLTGVRPLVLDVFQLTGLTRVLDVRPAACC